MFIGKQPISVAESTRVLPFILHQVFAFSLIAITWHRFNIATELTERCKNEGELGLVGILVWLRFMACRQLTWNKNYNVKPRCAFFKLSV